MPRFQPLFVALTTLLLTACGGSSAAPFEELLSTGFADYLGSVTPASQLEVVQDDARLSSTVYDFDPEDGPICLRGATFRVAARPGPSQNLLIYLQGGGACWSTLCVAFEDAEAVTNSGVPAVGILNPRLDGNPVADWDAVYVPYCDGSLFAGDVDRVVGGEMGYQRGLQNLSAALDLAKAQFPEPQRIVLAGVSGGGFGTITAAPLVRILFPDSDIVVINDSGIGLAKGDPAFVEGLLDEWKITEILPESCDDCTANGHLTNFLAWQLEQDPDLRMGAISSKGDFVIATTFLNVPPSEFEANVLSETARLAAGFPSRYNYFVYSGTKHTVLGIDSTIDLDAISPDERPGGLTAQQIENLLGKYDTTSVDGTSVVQWVDALLEGDAPNLVQNDPE